ncbi:MAG: hypothetical protein WCT54_01570 [Patescibacteria group bacterium]
MKRQRLLQACLLAIMLGASTSNSAMAASLSWTDLSAQIPTTTLDEMADYPLLSFASSRGTEWLVGNPNQLFQVTSQQKIFDLTPDLKKFGLQKIRQVASDGQGWIVVGDSSPWYSQPDLAFLYDGMYWKNASGVMASLPPQEWVGQIIGKRGLWIIPTSRGLFVWQSSLKTIANIPLPKNLMDNGFDKIDFYALKYGWLMAVEIGQDKHHYLFDGQNFQDVSPRIGQTNKTTAIGSNGAAALIVTAQTDTKIPKVTATYFDGRSSYKLDAHFRACVDQKNKAIKFFPESDIV